MFSKLSELGRLRDRLTGPRTRFRQRQKVEQAVGKILDQFGVQRWVKVDILEREEASYRQAGPGRPNAKTAYHKRVKTRYNLVCSSIRACVSSCQERV